jgi:small GTP-binding protein
MSKLILVDGQPIKYQIWDTAGQEKYHSLAPMYYRGAAAAVIVYDITRATTFTTLKNWVRELQQLGPENIVIAVCGSKADMEEKREVSRGEAEAYANEIGAIFLETSAKTNKGVQDVFMELCRKLPKPVSENFDNVADLRDTGKKGGKGEGKSGCC